ncbi:MAG TPA: type VI secretion system-associated protein TagF [Azospirillum sp.]|nr:type VI secretion system-associated protein TagF [Azospirillum sp.]
MSRARAASAPIEEAFGPGFHGKVPARGDFVAHDLPSRFVGPWDAWLQGALAESRVRLGPAWERLFAASPVWRFALGPGLCGGRAVAGVLVPSADRVGRLYPFVLAAALPAGVDLAAVPFGCAPWFGRAEAVALAACQDGADPRDSAAAMAALGRPDPGFAAHNPLHRQRLEAMVGPLPENPSLWWTRGAHWVTSSMVACRGLPGGERFAAFLDNGWERWGWDDTEEDARDDGAGGACDRI